MKRLFLHDSWSPAPIYDVPEYGFIVNGDGNIIRPAGKRAVLPTVYDFSWATFEKYALTMIDKSCEKKGQAVPRTGFWSLARLYHSNHRFGANRLSNILISPYTDLSMNATDKLDAGVIMDHRIDRNLAYTFSEPETVGIIGVQYNTPRSFMIWSPNNVMKWHLHD